MIIWTIGRKGSLRLEGVVAERVASRMSKSAVAGRKAVVKVSWRLKGIVASRTVGRKCSMWTNGAIARRSATREVSRMLEGIVTSRSAGRRCAWVPKGAVARRNAGREGSCGLEGVECRWIRVGDMVAVDNRLRTGERGVAIIETEPKGLQVMVPIVAWAGKNGPPVVSGVILDTWDLFPARSISKSHTVMSVSAQERERERNIQTHCAKACAPTVGSALGPC